MAKGRFGILGRLLLILLSVVVSLSASNLLILRWQTVHHMRPAPFLRAKQFAADVDLIANAPVATRSAALHALNGEQVWLAVRDRPPALGELIHAPRLEARLHAFARSPAGWATRVYTSPEQAHRDRRDGVEGFMALAVANLPDGRYLVATPVIRVADGRESLFGARNGLWIGLCGAVVAALAVYSAVREMAPLRQLARSLDSFEGAAPSAPLALSAAPEVQALAAAISAMQHRLSDLMRERTLMMGAVSHDLRTFLTRMQLRVLALDDENLQARFTADLDAMSALVEDALAFARGTDVKLARTSLDLADLVATEAAEREAVGDRLPIELVLSDAPVEGDSAALRRVVANLLDNAMRFGRSRVRASVERRDGWVSLAVEDDGPGVPAEARTAVLMPFYRVEGSRSRTTGGAGLGLTIASRIIEAHRGALKIETSRMGGALLQVLLPDPQIADVARSKRQHLTDPPSDEARTVQRVDTALPPKTTFWRPAGVNRP